MRHQNVCLPQRQGMSPGRRRRASAGKPLLHRCAEGCWPLKRLIVPSLVEEGEGGRRIMVERAELVRVAGDPVLSAGHDRDRTGRIRTTRLRRLGDSRALVVARDSDRRRGVGSADECRCPGRPSPNPCRGLLGDDHETRPRRSAARPAALAVVVGHSPRRGFGSPCRRGTGHRMLRAVAARDRQQGSRRTRTQLTGRVRARTAAR